MRSLALDRARFEEGISHPVLDGARASRTLGRSGWYRIHLKLTDSRGNTHEVFRDVYPQEPRRSALVR